MKLIDVKVVLDPEFHARTMEEALAAFVVIAKYKEELGTAENNLFGDVLGMAQIIFGRFKEAAGPNPSAGWNILAADQFKEEFSSALAGGKAFGCTEKQMKTFATYCQIIWKAIFNGCDILARGKDGNFVYGSRGKLADWNKKWEEKEKDRQAKAAMDKAIAENPKLAALRGGKETPADVQNPAANSDGLDALLATADAEVRDNIVAYVKTVVGMSKEPGTVTFKDVTETFLQKAIRVTGNHRSSVESIFAQDMAAIRNAAIALVQNQPNAA